MLVKRLVMPKSRLGNINEVSSNSSYLASFDVLAVIIFPANHFRYVAKKLCVTCVFIILQYEVSLL